MFFIILIICLFIYFLFYCLFDLIDKISSLFSEGRRKVYLHFFDEGENDDK